MFKDFAIHNLEIIFKFQNYFIVKIIYLRCKDRKSSNFRIFTCRSYSHFAPLNKHFSGAK